MTGFTVEMKVICCGAIGVGLTEADRHQGSIVPTANRYDHPR